MRDVSISGSDESLLARLREVILIVTEPDAFIIIYPPLINILVGQHWFKSLSKWKGKAKH